jgi:hypothetical protein
MGGAARPMSLGQKNSRSEAGLYSLRETCHCSKAWELSLLRLRVRELPNGDDMGTVRLANSVSDARSPAETSRHGSGCTHEHGRWFCFRCVRVVEATTRVRQPLCHAIHPSIHPGFHHVRASSVHGYSFHDRHLLYIVSSYVRPYSQEQDLSVAWSLGHFSWKKKSKKKNQKFENDLKSEILEFRTEIRYAIFTQEVQPNNGGGRHVETNVFIVPYFTPTFPHLIRGTRDLIWRPPPFVLDSTDDCLHESRPRSVPVET